MNLARFRHCCDGVVAAARAGWRGDPLPEFLPPPPASRDRPSGGSGDPLDRVVWHMTDRDAVTQRDACSNVLVFGQSGSGKSSTVLAQLMRAYFAELAGGIVLTTNRDDLAAIERAADDAGCRDRLAVVRPGGDFIYNPLDALVSEAGEFDNPAGRVVELLMTGLELFAQESGAQKGEKFWLEKSREYLTFSANLCYMARDGVSLTTVLDLINEAPRSVDEVNDEAWQAESVVETALAQAYGRIGRPGVRLTEADHARVAKFFLKEYPTSDPKPRDSVLMTIRGSLAPLVERPIDRLFEEASNVRAEDCWRHGIILVIDVPVSVYGAAGTLYSGLALTAFMKSVERRDLATHDGVVFLIADEFQKLYSRYATDFISYSRGKRAACLFATQSLPAFHHALGGGPAAKDAVDSLLANFGTVASLQLDKTTAEWAAGSIGEDWDYVTNVGTGKGRGGEANMFAGASEQKRHCLVEESPDRRGFG